jgi:hypothetical protein
MNLRPQNFEPWMQTAVDSWNEGNARKGADYFILPIQE